MPSANAIYITQLDASFDLPEGQTLGNSNSEHYIESLKKLNRLPFSKGEIYYSEDIWDFTAFTQLNINKKNLRFHFEDLAQSAYKDVLKNMVLLSLLENNCKIQTIQKRYANVKWFLRYVEQERHLYKVEDISINVIKDYLQKVRDEGSVTKLRDTKTYLRAFYMQYSSNFTGIASKGILDLFEQDDYKAFKAYKYEHRTDDIPKDYFDLFVSACIQFMNDKDIPFYFRGTACIYVILSQTGLRIGEILGLRTNSLRTTKIFNGQEVNYLDYYTWKREDGNNKSTKAFTYINELSRKAYDVLMEVYEPRRQQFGLDYLYMGGKIPSASTFPIDSEGFKKTAFTMFAELDNRGLLRTVDLSDDVWPSVHRFNVSNGKVRSVRLNKRASTLTYPSSQQFRFHCCTVLAEKGVPLEYIQRFMSHLTNDMVRYHVLPQNSPQEDMEYSLKVLKEVVSGKTTILGDNKGIMDKINEFIEENHFRVEKDIDAICEGLAKNIPIRQKTGGVCIKSSQLRDCSIDAKTNEFYCAYSVCPNIVHFYYMADISYRQCCELQESIGINQQRGHKKQVQKERHMLYSIVSKRLAPELEDLRKVVERDGVESVIMMHPELTDIISNLKDIEKEAAEWMSTNG